MDAVPEGHARLPPHKNTRRKDEIAARQVLLLRQYYPASCV
jgi:hypothetical protein